MKVSLVKDWKQVHKWFSTWLAAISASTGALALEWQSLPDSWKSGLPHALPSALGWIAVVCAFLVPPARIIRQGHSDEG